ncbi:hypothetical protein, partial [uncultured Carboxylicivirga sp.]|uniref:hypothetical protein n=1 Tax=uncultured Carboxylicivirga sp. TaxID=1628156 RepID=UPI002613F797
NMDLTLMNSTLHQADLQDLNFTLVRINPNQVQHKKYEIFYRQIAKRDFEPSHRKGKSSSN